MFYVILGNSYKCIENKINGPKSLALFIKIIKYDKQSYFKQATKVYLIKTQFYTIFTTL